MFREPLLPSSMQRRTAGFRPLPRVQTKLTRGSALGSAERDADAMASQVMAGQTVRAAPGGLADSEAGLALSPQVATSLRSSKGGGAPLADSVRRQLEPRFAFDFADVRVHDDATAHAMNQALGARAFTHGSDIYLSPQVRADVNPVMAHELAHVTQQSGMLHCQTLQSMPADKPKEPPRVGPITPPGGCFLRVYAKGTQEYFHDKNSGERKNIPRATLYADRPGGKVIGRHGASPDGNPFWEFGPMGRVDGNKPKKLPYEGLATTSRLLREAQEQACLAEDAAWLEMPASGGVSSEQHLGSDRVSTVRRVDVVGGGDPNKEPKDFKNRNYASIPYTCAYEFFK